MIPCCDLLARSTFATNIYAETMEHCRYEETEAILRDIIANGRDEVASFLLDTVGQLEEQGEEAGCGDRRVEEERHDYDGSGDPMLVQEGARGDGSGDRTESGQVNIVGERSRNSKFSTHHQDQSME